MNAPESRLQLYGRLAHLRAITFSQMFALTPPCPRSTLGKWLLLATTMATQ